MHAESFTDELGTIQPFTVSLQVRSDVSPLFQRPRSVPFAIKDDIESELNHLESCGILEKVPFAIKDDIMSELNRLESRGILEKVDYSGWAAPIVAVPKKDGKIHICGDYKVTVNKILEVDQ